MRISPVKLKELMESPAIQILMKDKNVDGKDVMTVDEKLIAIGILLDLTA